MPVGSLLANYGNRTNLLGVVDQQEGQRVSNRLNQYKLDSAVKDDQRQNRLRELAPQALQGDQNALNQVAGVDVDVALRIKDALAKMSKEERDLANEKTLGVMRVTQLADTPEKWSRTGLGIPWEQRGELIARGSALKEGYEAIMAAEKQSYDRDFDLEKLASEERRSLRKGASKPFKIGEDDMGQPIFGQWDAEAGEIVPIGVSGQASPTPVQEAERLANDWYQQNASMFKSDKSQFNGMNEQQVKTWAAQEYAAGRVPDIGSSSSGNILNTEPQADPLLAQLQANRGPATQPAQAAISANKLNARTSSTARPAINPQKEAAITQELNSIQSAMLAMGEAVKRQGKMSPDIEAQLQQLSARQNELLSELKSVNR